MFHVFWFSKNWAEKIETSAFLSAIFIFWGHILWLSKVKGAAEYHNYSIIKFPNIDGNLFVPFSTHPYFGNFLILFTFLIVTPPKSLVMYFNNGRCSMYIVYMLCKISLRIICYVARLPDIQFPKENHLFADLCCIEGYNNGHYSIITTIYNKIQ